MKKILLLFCLFCTFSGSYAQNYIDYHKTIIQAEQEILKENYTQALQHYQELFKDYDFVFAIDYFTATQLAVQTQQYETAFQYLRNGVKKGISMKLIMSNEILSELDNQKGWNAFEADYDRLRETYPNSIDTEICSELQSLYETNVSMTQQHNPAEPFSVAYSNMKSKKMVRKHATTVMDIMQLHGFPGEKLVGLDECTSDLNSNQSHIVGKDVFLNSKMAFVMLTHYYSEPNKSINDKLMKELKKGNLDPSQFAIINDYMAEYGDGRFGNFSYYNQWRNVLKEGEENIINKKRERIGLGSFEHRMAKLNRWKEARMNQAEGRTIYIRY